MKISLLLVLMVMTTSIQAEEYQSFGFCKSSLTKQMKRFEKTPFTIPKKLPSGNLKIYAERLEIICPWQIERDFNADKMNDWVGIIKRNGQFELVAYLSGSRKFNLQVLHTYPFFPEQSYLRVLKSKTNKQNKPHTNRKRNFYDVVEVHLNDTSRIYALKKGIFSVISQYEDKTIFNTYSDDSVDDEENID